MLKKYRLGFDPWGLALFLVTMIPTFVWTAVPAPYDVLRTESDTPIADAVGFVLQVLFVATICFVVRKEAIRKTAFMVATIVCVALYFAGWVFYYLGITTPAIILLLSLPPCLAFICYAIGRGNLPALAFAAGFTVCHLIFATINFII